MRGLFRSVGFLLFLLPSRGQAFVHFEITVDETLAFRWGGALDYAYGVRILPSDTSSRTQRLAQKFLLRTAGRAVGEVVGLPFRMAHLTPQIQKRSDYVGVRVRIPNVLTFRVGPFAMADRIPPWARHVLPWTGFPLRFQYVVGMGSQANPWTGKIWKFLVKAEDLILKVHSPIRLRFQYRVTLDGPLAPARTTTLTLTEYGTTSDTLTLITFVPPRPLGALFWGILLLVLGGIVFWVHRKKRGTSPL